MAASKEAAEPGAGPSTTEKTPAQESLPPRVVDSVTRDEIEKAFSDFEIRLNAVIDSEGSHFQEGFKRFKTKYLREHNLSVEPCELCERVH